MGSLAAQDMAKVGAQRASLSLIHAASKSLQHTTNNNQQPERRAKKRIKRRASSTAAAAPPRVRATAPVSAPREELKMVLCVNTSLGMGKGKIGAQCAHAAVGVLQKFARRCGDAFAQWEMSGQPKITVKVKDEGEMVRGVVVIACAVDFCALCVCVCVVSLDVVPHLIGGAFSRRRAHQRKNKNTPPTPQPNQRTRRRRWRRRPPR